MMSVLGNDVIPQTRDFGEHQLTSAAWTAKGK
jgi:hypothetical protein